MNDIVGPVLAIAATIVLLLLRELILSVGKKGRSNYGVPDHRSNVPDLEGEPRFREHPIIEFKEPVPQATPIAVDEFLAELRAKAQEHLPHSRTRTGSTTDIGRTQSNRKMTEDLW